MPLKDVECCIKEKKQLQTLKDIKANIYLQEYLYNNSTNKSDSETVTPPSPPLLLFINNPKINKFPLLFYHLAWDSCDKWLNNINTVMLDEDFLISSVVQVYQSFFYNYFILSLFNITFYSMQTLFPIWSVHFFLCILN
jgi:hypothetical protein